jgi:hypothetical protein
MKQHTQKTVSIEIFLYMIVRKWSSIKEYGMLLTCDLKVVIITVVSFIYKPNFLEPSDTTIFIPLKYSYRPTFSGRILPSSGVSNYKTITARNSLCYKTTKILIYLPITVFQVCFSRLDLKP